MKKSEMQEKFRMLLEDRKEQLKRAVVKGNNGVALMQYGEICGVAASMRKLVLIDYDQAQYIRDEAWAIYQGKEPEYEAC